MHAPDSPATDTVAPEVDGFTHVRTLGGIHEYRLDANGLQVLVLAEAAAPVATFMLTYRVGSRNERTGLTGATHFLEHLMFKGTERFNKAAGTSVFNVLQAVGAQVNATTWLDRTNYFGLLPKAHLERAVEIEADRMRGVLLDPEAVESERTVILNEFDRGENEPLRRLYHAVWSAAFVAHPYHHPTIGWRSDIEQVTRDGLKHFYDRYYWPDNATASVIGDVTVEGALGLVHKHFGEIPAAPEPIPVPTTREPEQDGERRVTVRLPGELGAVLAAWKTPSALEDDTDALDVLMMLLTTGRSSRLHRALVDAGHATHCFGSVGRHRDPSLASIYALLAPGKTHEEVEAMVLAEVARVGEEGVTEAEVERAKTQLKAQEAFSRDGSYAVAAQLNEAIAAGDWALFVTYRERLGRVAAEDVQRVARKYLRDERRTSGWYVPAN